MHWTLVIFASNSSLTSWPQACMVHISPTSSLTSPPNLVLSTLFPKHHGWRLSAHSSWQLSGLQWPTYSKDGFHPHSPADLLEWAAAE